MPRHNIVLIFEQGLDFGIYRAEIGILFEVCIFIWQDKPLFALGIGEVKGALGVYEDILLFDDIEIFVADNIAESAYFCRRFVYAGTFDIKKYKTHRF